MAKDDDDKVGYGKPPKHSRFRKGQSGNPSGRPQGSRNFKTIFRAVMDEQMTITDQDGRKLVVNMQEVIIRRMATQAANGNLKATDMMLSLERDFANQEALARDFPHMKGHQRYPTVKEMNEQELMEAARKHLKEKMEKRVNQAISDEAEDEEDIPKM